MFHKTIKNAFLNLYEVNCFSICKGLNATWQYFWWELVLNFYLFWTGWPFFLFHYVRHSFRNVWFYVLFSILYASTIVAPN